VRGSSKGKKEEVRGEGSKRKEKIVTGDSRKSKGRGREGHCGEGKIGIRENQGTERDILSPKTLQKNFSLAANKFPAERGRGRGSFKNREGRSWT